jgi:hypothetical protein
VALQGRGQFVAHAAALPGKPYDGHTLAAVVPAIEVQNGATLTRVIVAKGYRGHNAPTVGASSSPVRSGASRRR